MQNIDLSNMKIRFLLSNSIADVLMFKLKEIKYLKDLLIVVPYL